MDSFSKNLTLSTVSLRNSTDSQLSQRIWLEVGHSYEPRRWASGRAVPEDWRVWVRGVSGADISELVEKVVFQLCPDTQFPYPKKICLDAPYQLEEAGSTPKQILIDIHFKRSTKPEILQFKYGSLFAKPDQSSANSSCIFYDFRNPSDQLRMSVLKSMSATRYSGSALVVLRDSGEVRRHHNKDLPTPTHCDMTQECAKLYDPVLTHKQMLLFESCPVCDNL